MVNMTETDLSKLICHNVQKRQRSELGNILFRKYSVGDKYHQFLFFYMNLTATRNNSSGFDLKHQN